MTIKGPWDAKTTALGMRLNELAQALPKQLQTARCSPSKVSRPATICAGGALGKQQRMSKEFCDGRRC